MTRTLLILALLSLTLGGALAKSAVNPPTAEQKAAFLKKCLTIAPEAQTLCTCKANAAMTLIDTDFMAVVIAAMSGSLDPKYNVAYSDYIGRSNKICKPDY